MTAKKRWFPYQQARIKLKQPDVFCLPALQAKRKAEIIPAACHSRLENVTKKVQISLHLFGEI